MCIGNEIDLQSLVWMHLFPLSFDGSPLASMLTLETTSSYICCWALGSSLMEEILRVTNGIALLHLVSVERKNSR